MAKKGKAKRPSGARGKKKAARKAVKKSVAAKAAPTGLEHPDKVDFKYLKAHIKAHIDKLSGVPNPSEKVRNALKTLTQTQFDLTNECQPTMVIPTS